MDMTQRGLTIYFCDGSKLSIEFPVQTPNEMAALLKLEEVLKQRQIERKKEREIEEREFAERRRKEVSPLYPV